MIADGLKFQFVTDGEGNYGYLGADDSLIPFKSSEADRLALIYTLKNTYPELTEDNTYDEI